jgi:hypothetical protein
MNVKKLSLSKETLTTLNPETIVEAAAGITAYKCTSVTQWQPRGCNSDNCSHGPTCGAGTPCHTYDC